MDRLTIAVVLLALDLAVVSGLILHKLEKLAMSLSAAQQALADLQAQADTINTSVQKAIAQLQALKAQVAAGQGVAPADVEAVVATLKGTQTALDTEDASTT